MFVRYVIASQTVVRTIHLVRISDEEKLHETYLDDDAVESTSLYETLPGTLRSLSNRFHVLINGRKAPILGRICMDQLMVDVTDIPGVVPGAKVTLIGADGAETITMEEISAQAGSFSYEFACGISRRVPRNYIMGGQVVRHVDYLL